MSFFSIIIPIYNAEKFLEKTLDSIAGQSCKDYQVIMVNDGSKDSSEEICRRYAEKYPEFRLISKENSGVSDTRNTGIENADGKYIVFVDSDDLLLDGALEALKKKITENEYPDIVLGNYCTRYPDRYVKERDVKEGMYQHNDNTLERKIIDFYFVRSDCGNLRTVWAKAFSSELIKSNKIHFNRDIRIGEDMAFFLECVCNCKNYLVVNDRLYEYLINSNSVMQSMKWNGFNKNIQYLHEIERINKQYQLGIDLTSVWLEISEKEWILFDRAAGSFSSKCKELSSIMKNDLYKEYSSKEHNAGRFGKLMGLYTFAIRHRLTLMFMALISAKSKKLQRGA